MNILGPHAPTRRSCSTSGRSCPTKTSSCPSIPGTAKQYHIHTSVPSTIVPFARQYMPVPSIIARYMLVSTDRQRACENNCKKSTFRVQTVRSLWWCAFDRGAHLILSAGLLLDTHVSKAWPLGWVFEGLARHVLALA